MSRESEARGGGAGGAERLGGGDGFRQNDARGAEQEKQLAGPKQNVEQASALEIAEIFGLQADVERFARAFFHEGAHAGKVDGIFAKLLAARIDGFETCVTALEKMVQAKSLVIFRFHSPYGEGSNRGAIASAFAAVSVRKLCNHLAQLLYLHFVTYYTTFSGVINKMLYATQMVSSGTAS